MVLERLAEVAVPADEFPSAAEVGAVAFVERVLTLDRPDWLERVERALEVAGPEPDLEAVLADDDGAWLVRLVLQGYYAEPRGVGDGRLADR